MVLGVGKKSEISLKTEDFDPCQHPSPNLNHLSQTVQEVIFGPMNYFLVTDRQTDGRKATHKSPPCMSTGGLKN